MVRGTWKTVIRDVDRLYAEGTSSGWSDDQLLSRFLTAREEADAAFETIVRRHGPMVLEVCHRLLGNRDDAQDAFQATFLVLARRAGAIAPHPSGSLGPWLHQVACRTAQKARVARRRREVRERRAAARVGTITQDEHPTSVEYDEYRVLHEEVAQLPEKYRAAVVLCYFEALTHDQAAAALRWPVGTVRGYLARARDMLRSRLVRRGVAPALAISVLDSGRSLAATLAPPLVEMTLRAIAKGSVASTVAALSGAIVRGLMVARARRALVVVLVLALGTGSAGLVATHRGARIDPEGPSSRLRIAATRSAEQPVPRAHVDLYGDPLPDGAVARLGTVRLNTASGVGGVAFTPDGKSLASFSFGNGTARIWDPSTGRERRAVEVEELQGGRIFTLSPDGTSILGAERDYNARCMFRLWDTNSGREQRRQIVPKVQGFSMLAYSPDGRTLATLLSGQTVVFWDAEKFSEIRRFQHKQLSLVWIAFSPDSRTLAVAAEDSLKRMLEAQGQVLRNDPAREKGSVRLWDVASGREIRRLPIEGGDARCVVFSPDGRMLAASFYDATIRLFNPTDGEELARIKVNGPMQHRLAFSPDGTILASADDVSGGAPRLAAGIVIGVAAGDAPGDKARHVAAVHLWDVPRRTELLRLPGHDEFVFGIAFSPDGKTLASAGAQKAISLWEVSTGREMFPSVAHRSSVACVVISPADRSVITGGYDNAIRRWDPTTGRELGVIGTHPDPVYDLAMSGDGRFLLSSSLDASVRLWDTTVAQKQGRIMAVDPESRGRGLAFSRDGQLTTAAGKIWEVASGRELATLRDEQGKPFRPWASAAFTPDARGLIATDGGTIWLFDVASGRTVRQVAAPGRQISSIALSPDGRFLASGVNHSVRLWHLPTGREIKQSMGHEAKTNGAASNYVTAAFSPDGRLLVSGSGADFYGGDPSVRVWELASGQEVRRFNGHRAGVYAVAFFPDGHRIASASADATAMVWDLSATDLPRPMNVDSLWVELNNDANRAYRAIGTLVASPEQAVALLSDRLQPIRSDDPDKDTSIGPIATGETLRRLRAIAVLEKVGTREARRVLERLATGLDGARETRDARSALRRLK
jgi:RNA polymerase sigma factor (sigma-70 family)